MRSRSPSRIRPRATAGRSLEARQLNVNRPRPRCRTATRGARTKPGPCRVRACRARGWDDCSCHAREC
jgi:hypothetical protein